MGRIQIRIFNIDQNGYVKTAHELYKMVSVGTLLRKWAYELHYWYWKTFQKDVVRK